MEKHEGEVGAISARLEAFLADSNALPTPFVVVDTQVVGERYDSLQAALPQADLFYAVKANPAPPILKLLLARGAHFDVASPGEIDLCLAAGATTDRISYGNTIKKRDAIRYAYEKGVRLFSFDAESELEKLAELAPEATIFCRVLCDGAGAEWPLSRKFGCEPEEAERLLHLAADRGMKVGVSFHVGSQQGNIAAWDTAIETAGQLARSLYGRSEPVRLDVVNVGGGFPGIYQRQMPSIGAYGDSITSALERTFAPLYGSPQTGGWMPRIIAEPGRYLVADAGVLRTEVVLVSRKCEQDEKRWVFLDCGKFGGLAETMDESIKYHLRTPHDEAVRRGAPTGAVILAGPTCDSADVLYEKTDYRLPIALSEGDKIDILSTGAYTTTYASIGFNGFAPLAEHYI
ncbi:type III PLP-dependent enzyme [Botrimarina hoheduenensis]|nr:type III PLP-dependent enzyme [Botrimarina hoheduenensis]